MSNKPLTLSIIIPAYNEERHLPDCLDSIAAQTVMPDEVIVVDNNSMDATAKIARSYPFVKVVAEKKQGLIAARNCGLNNAKSDLLARIDADSVLQADWVETVHDEFDDKSVDAITGPALTCVDTHFPRWQSTMWSRIYFAYARSTYRIQVLWGPNMVLRKRAWTTIRSEANTDDKMVHEDQDLSVFVRSHDLKIKYVPTLVISADGRRFASIPKALEYNARHRRTMKLHKERLENMDRLSRPRAKLIELLLIPFSLLFSVSSLFYMVEKKFGLRRD